MWSSPPPPSAKQVMRREQRSIVSSQRELEREANNLKRQEQTLMAELKAEARKPGGGNQTIMKIKARDIAKIRGQIEKLQKTGASMGSIATQTQVAATTATIATALGSATRAMSTASGAISVEAMQRNMLELERHQQTMEITDEMLDDMFAVDEGETDDVLDRVFDELGLEVGAKLATVPVSASPLSIPSSAPAVASTVDPVDEMIAKLLAS